MDRLREIASCDSREPDAGFAQPILHLSLHVSALSLRDCNGRHMGTGAWRAERVARPKKTPRNSVPFRCSATATAGGKGGTQWAIVAGGRGSVRVAKAARQKRGVARKSKSRNGGRNGAATPRLLLPNTRSVCFVIGLRTEMKRIFRLRGSWLIFLYETIAKEATALWSPRYRGFQT